MNELVQILDPASKLSIIFADCPDAAAALARGHLSGPTASAYLAQALAAAAILSVETTQKDETVTFRLDAPDGALKGFLVEATEKGTLRGYTKQKVLNDFDGTGKLPDAQVLGPHGTFEVIRSIPGSILASGSVAIAPVSVAEGLESYFVQSLQRRIRVALAAAAGDDGVPVLARGLAVECPPDGDDAAYLKVSDLFDSGAVRKALATPAASVRTLLKKLGLPHAEIRSTRPLAFACRCSLERVEGMIAGLPPADRAALAASCKSADIVCHMCGRMWSVPPATLAALAAKA